MKTICLYFEIHQITHLKRYRFFDIGTDHYYYDDYANERSITYIAEHSSVLITITMTTMPTSVVSHILQSTLICRLSQPCRK